MSKQPYQVTAIKAFNDNYIWLIGNQESKHCAVVDPGDAIPVIDYILQHQLQLEAILITHHHHDHVGGVADLLRKFGDSIPVFGPTKEANEVVTRPLCHGSHIDLNAIRVPCQIVDVPGHTLGHIAYVTPTSVFCGDTLFSAGCGRMFEGNPQMFQQSLARLSALPPATKVYCAHEYTLANLAFAKTVSPDCGAIDDRINQAQQRRAQGRATIPTTIEIERATNPFLRLGEPQIQASIAANSRCPISEDIVDNFAALRRWKDDF